MQVSTLQMAVGAAGGGTGPHFEDGATGEIVINRML